MTRHTGMRSQRLLKPKEADMSFNLFFLILALVLALVASVIPSAGRVALFPLAFASFILSQLWNA
jgi:hypothetical protein